MRGPTLSEEIYFPLQSMNEDFNNRIPGFAVALLDPFESFLAGDEDCHGLELVLLKGQLLAFGQELIPQRSPGEGINHSWAINEYHLRAMHKATAFNFGNEYELNHVEFWLFARNFPTCQFRTPWNPEFKINSLFQIPLRRKSSAIGKYSVARPDCFLIMCGRNISVKVGVRRVSRSFRAQEGKVTFGQGWNDTGKHLQSTGEANIGLGGGRVMNVDIRAVLIQTS